MLPKMVEKFRKILFSPVGSNDPLGQNNHSDGSLVQVIKKTRPDEVYLYFSKDFAEVEADSHLIELYLGDVALAEHLNFSITKLYQTENLTAGPHIFDTYYREFTNKLTTIIDHAEQKYDSNTPLEIILNVSSGTPAMKSALFIITSTMNVGQFNNCKFSSYQVSSPASNWKPAKKEYTKELYLNNPDSADHVGSRAQQVADFNFEKFLTRRKAIEFVRSYNYDAAQSLLKEDSVDKITWALLSYGKARRQMQKDTFLKEPQAQLLQKIFGNKFLTPDYTTISKHKHNYKITDELYEYLLNIQALAHNNQAADFFRALTPALAMLFEDALRNSFSVLNNDSIYQHTKGAFGTIELKDLPEVRSYVYDYLGLNTNRGILLNTIGLLGTYRGCHDKNVPINSRFNSETIKEIYNTMAYFRVIEDAIRNQLAHNIISSQQFDSKVLKTVSARYPKLDGSLWSAGQLLIDLQDLNKLMANLKRLSQLIYPGSQHALTYLDYQELNHQIAEYIDGTKKY